jgi:glutamate-1-semialdehyde 2,1-aminomutase
MSALRLARAYTGRDKILKFEGCYHGHSDGLLIKGGSGQATLGVPDSPGVPAGYAQNTVVAPYNDAGSVEKIFRAFPGDIAAIIVEPVAANMGVVPPQPGFLPRLRSITSEYGALLIFDEVITGFRLGRGGAQGVFGVKPDLTCLGKIIGGGLPVGAYGGRRDLMEMMAPVGSVYQAGTLSGNPIAMTAGIETLKALQQPDFYRLLDGKASVLEKGITAAFAGSNFKVHIARCGSLITVFFTPGPVTDWNSAKQADTASFRTFFHGLLDQGVYWPSSQFEAAFVSGAHSDIDIHATILAMKKVAAQ